MTQSPHAVDTDSWTMRNVMTEANMIEDTRVSVEAFSASIENGVLLYTNHTHYVKAFPPSRCHWIN
jgi:hypothetical protein